MNLHSKKNVSYNLLFIGDYRPGKNFGAIATSTCLMEIVKQVVGEHNLFVIDSRSFNGLSPQQGYGLYEMPEIESLQNQTPKKISVQIEDSSSLKSIIKHNLLKVPFLASTIRLLKRKFTNLITGTGKDTPIPARFEDFDKMARSVMKGEIMHFEYQLLSHCDAVYVNGEGNIVHNIHNKGGDYRIGARYILFMLYLAKKHFNKPCVIVNHIVDPDQEEAREMIRQVYPLCNRVLVREPASLRTLTEIGFSGAEYVPDALFNYNVNPSLIDRFNEVGAINFSQPFVCLGDSAYLGYLDWSIEDFYKQIIPILKDKYGQVVFIDGGMPKASPIFEKVCKELEIFRITVQNTSFEELAAVLAHSKVFISGRWHASILATISGTPCVLFGTDSHKTQALHQLTALPSQFYAIETLPNRINELLLDVEKTVLREPELRQTLKAFSEDCRERTQVYGDLIREIFQ